MFKKTFLFTILIFIISLIYYEKESNINMCNGIFIDNKTITITIKN